MATQHRIMSGWRVAVLLSEVDDVGYVLFDGHQVCASKLESKRATEREIDVTSLLHDGINRIDVVVHNIFAEGGWRLRHRIRVRDAAGLPVPTIPDAAMDITDSGEDGVFGERAKHQYEFVR